MIRHFALVCLLATPALAEDRALIIGIEGYPDLDLRLAPQSAKEDALATAQLAVTEWGYTHTQVSLLLDSAATSDAILNALIDEIVGLTAPGDRALIYFAGLGSRTSRAERVLLAYDSESLLGRIPEGAISDILDLISDRAVTVIIDAGFSGDIATPGQRGIGAPGFETAPFAANGDARAVYAASTASQTVWETAQGGIFTTNLIAGATGAADQNGDGQISHAELSGFAAQRSTAWCDTHRPCTLAGLSVDFAGPASASPMSRAMPPATTTPDTTLPNPAQLTLTIDGGPTLTIGHSATFRAKSGDTGTFVLLDIAPDGTVAQLYPSSLAPGTGLTSGTTLVIPSALSTSGAQLRMRVTGPGGSGQLISLFTPGDRPELARDIQGQITTASPDDITTVMNRLAGPGVWSATLTPYTIMEP